MLRGYTVTGYMVPALESPQAESRGEGTTQLLSSETECGRHESDTETQCHPGTLRALSLSVWGALRCPHEEMISKLDLGN